MSFFSTTSSLEHRTLLPPPSTREAAIALLRDHTFFLTLDPEYVSHIEETPPKDAPPNTRYYEVTDHMNALPKAIYDAKVVFRAEILDVEDGLKLGVKAPLGLVQNSYWRVVEEGEGEEKKLYLVETVNISCSRLLMGTVRAKCNENWKFIHGLFVEKLLEVTGKDTAATS